MIFLNAAKYILHKAIPSNIANSVERRWKNHLLLNKKLNNSSNQKNLVISVTSYHPRFPTLHLSLKSVLMQMNSEDRLVLWVTKSDYNLLPSNTRMLEIAGLEIRITDEYYSYKKLIPALELFPLEAIVTIDDDIYYPNNWLSHFKNCSINFPKEILCQCAREIPSKSSLIKSYRQWSRIFKKNAQNILPIGAGGVYYPASNRPSPGELKNLLEHSKYSDDLGFYWAWKNQGASFRFIGGNEFPRSWKGSQNVALWKTNKLMGRNDQYIKNLVDHYGMP